MKGVGTRMEVVLLIVDCGAPQVSFSSRRAGGRAEWEYVQIYASIVHVTFGTSVLIVLLVAHGVDIGTNANIRGIRCV